MFMTHCLYFLKELYMVVQWQIGHLHFVGKCNTLEPLLLDYVHLISFILEIQMRVIPGKRGFIPKFYQRRDIL
jgi:hypothetical protein